MGKLSKQVKWAQDVLVRKTMTTHVGGTITAADEPFKLVAPEDGNFQSCVVSLGTAPTDASAIFDVNLNGTTFYTTQASRPTIVTTEFVSTEAAGPDITAFAKGDVITFACDQIGSTVAGADAQYMFTYLAKAV